jgi:hypothetical protein
MNMFVTNFNRLKDKKIDEIKSSEWKLPFQNMFLLGEYFLIQDNTFPFRNKPLILDY